MIQIIPLCIVETLWLFEDLSTCFDVRVDQSDIIIGIFYLISDLCDLIDCILFKNL